ncbi:hypothetical protein, partial [Cronobacter sakazakii]|uniref:hypothetical protein n=1 Tax=Cronobacter sakazakii TaxID=28141 RepID=UPI00294AB19D
LPDFFFLPLLLLFLLFLFLFLFLFLLLSNCCRQKNGNTTTRRALAPFGSRPALLSGRRAPLRQGGRTRPPVSA